MAITLDAITLPTDLIWQEKNNFSALVQKQTRSLGGNLIIQQALKIKGRKITLAGDTETAWITQTDIDLINAKRDTPDTTMVLTINGQSFNVLFDFSIDKPVNATPVYDHSDPQSEHPYSITLHFIEV